MISDTSILIGILGNNAVMQEKLEKIDERIATTGISMHELLKASKEDTAKALLDTMEIYQFDTKAAERSEKLFKELKKKGRLINEFDILIASIAIAHDELLVTRDNDFRNVDSLKLLVL